MTSRRVELWRSEAGSLLPFIGGFVFIALTFVLVFVNASTLYSAKQQLQAAADASALSAADGFDVELRDGVPVAVVDRAAMTEKAREVAQLNGAELVSLQVPEGVSVRVVVRSEWEPFIVGWLITDITLEAEATSRTALN